MNTNETYLFPLGQRSISVTGTDFLDGYSRGYKRAPLNCEETISDQDIAHFLSTHTGNREQQAIFQAGYIVGAIAAVVELLKGDCQIHWSVTFQPNQKPEKKEGN